MKLNYRDKVILGILLAIVILLLGFFLLIKKTNQEIKDNKAILAEVQQQKDEIDAKIAEIKPLKTKIKATYDETTKLTDDFVAYNDIYNARKADQYMQHFAEDSEVKIKTLSVSDLTVGQLSYYYLKHSVLAEDQLTQADLNGDRQAANEDLKAEANALAARTQESVLVSNYSVTVEGDKEKIFDYLKAIEEQDKTIIINSVSLTNVPIGEKAEQKLRESAEGGEIPKATANLTISLYSVYDLSEPNLEAD
jgi:Tfp pilus assembly protein PilO